MQMFYIQSILNQAVPTDNYNIVAKNRVVTIRRSYTGELAKLYSDDDLNSELLPNPITTDNLGQFKFYAPDGKYKAYDVNNILLAEFVLQDPFMTIREFSDADSEALLELSTVGLSGLNHNNHLMIDSASWVEVKINAPTMDSPTDFQKGVMIFITQIGQGVIELIEAEGIELIYDELTTSAQTAGPGTTIGLTSRNPNQWVVVGRVGY